GLCDDDRPEDLLADPERKRGGEEPLVAALRLEGEVERVLPVLDRALVDDALRQWREGLALARERVDPARDGLEEDPVAGRQLEPLRREQLEASLLTVELGQTVGLASDLVVGLAARLALRVRAEQPQRDRGRDEARDYDAEEEKGRKLEAQRPQHRGPCRLGADRRVPRGRDLVADPPDGDDRRGVAELAAELAHVDVDRARVAGERVAPDPLQQLVARQHEAVVVEQLPEQVELLRRQLDLLACDLC